MSSYPETVNRLESLVRTRPRTETMVALIIDSPWLPGYAGVGTMDFYFDPATWLSVHERARADLPGVAFVPGSWVELGLAAEPSGWGVPIHWSDSQPPGVGHHRADLAALAALPVPDPERDGVMPIILNQYERMRRPLSERGLAPRMAAARGPLAVASHVHGVSDFLVATLTDPENCHTLLDRTTDLCIAWLKAQLERMIDPIGVIVLDDLVGMLSPQDAETFALPRLKRIFDAFAGMITIFHNDTPNEAVFPGLSTVGMDIFNFSHTTDLARARELVGPDIVLMGNLPPLELLVRGTPEQVREATKRQLERRGDVGPLLVSPGGGVSPGTPIANLQAMVEEVEGHSG
jgi:uroporphyrinogen decarboxylase